MDKILAENRKAHYEYSLLERFSAGLVLSGHEAKSLRNGGGSFAGSFVSLENGEAWLKNFDIRLYDKTTLDDYQSKRPRKLLLTKRELGRIEAAIHENGITIVPTAIGLQKKRIKLEIAVARGKKSYDKRASIKEKDITRRLRRLDD